MNSKLDFRQGTNICLRVVRGVGQTYEGGGEDSLRGSGVRIRIKKCLFKGQGENYMLYIASGNVSVNVCPKYLLS